MNPNLRDLARETRNPEVKLEKIVSGIDTKDRKLVYATPQGIFALSDKEKIPLLENPVNQIHSMCFFQDQIYYATVMGIYDLKGRRKDGSNSHHICASEKRMYSTYNNLIYFGEEEFDNVIDAEMAVSAVHAHGDVLWYASRDPNRHNLFAVQGTHIIDDEPGPADVLHLTPDPISSICWCDDLYISADKSIFRASSHEKFAELPWHIKAMAAADSRLWAFSEHDLFDVTNMKCYGKIYNVVAMCSAPSEFLVKYGVPK
jgi:hypothetical protein